MRKIILGFIAVMMFSNSFAQDTINEEQNSAEQMLNNYDRKLMIGGYSQIDYNQPFGGDLKQNGNLDVHRLVMLFSYKFNKRTSFVTEIEYEHVKEVFIEQAFLNYKINKYINFRGGLLLIPMGIINEYHEPTTFNGVERPNLDSKIIPTTWREIGAGFTGRFTDLSLKYQIYIVNGFNGYDGEGKFTGSKGLRNGRQKGAKSFMSNPNFTGKIDYYGIMGLRIGLSAYHGKSQSILYDGVTPTSTADSSVVGMSMFGIDFRYNIKGLQLRGQYNYTKLSNTEQYNEFTNNDLGSAMNGYYVEGGYNILRPFKSKTELIPFVRYENYNTQFKVVNSGIKNTANNRTEITSGIGWKIDKGAILKADVQYFTNEASNDWKKQLNLGIGIWF
ncbi:MAG: hypothetical protein PF487_08560 [Bacteroidales bacterium]|jgi:hypothetical protein|nr:hypothetical protein [Bacteroidales bacterium]